MERHPKTHVLLLILCIFSVAAHAADYDPLKLSDTAPGAPVDFSVHDGKRDRDIPLRVYLPVQKTPAPVVLFSHGLGGSRENNPYLGKHWAARGYAVVFLQHAGSDESIWKDAGPVQRGIAMKQAASPKNFLLRAADVPAVLDQLAHWNSVEKDHPLHGRLDLKRIGMSGHSFGAVTTQAVSGQTLPGGRQNFTDSRICAAVLMSPSPPALGSTERAFGSVKLPWLVMTGTKDVARLGGIVIGADDAARRLTIYPALPPGDKYELVLHDAEHSAFGDRTLPGESGQRNPNHHRVILALSTAFWDAFVKGDAAAMAWLNGDGPRRVMEKEDRWQHK
jgi:predicted dienelactone hydrolase